MELQVGVKAFIQNTDGKYLALQRAKPYPGDTKPKWDIPGGRINVGEELIAALSREIKEETGMELQGTPTLVMAQDIIRDKHVVRLTYLASAEGIIALDPAEHQAYQWMSLEEMRGSYHDVFLTPVITLLRKPTAPTAV
jgi:8-oxo-dGTP diphosphatase